MKNSVRLTLMFLALTLITPVCHAQAAGIFKQNTTLLSLLNNATSRMHRVEILLVGLLHERRAAVREFVEEHGGDDLLQKNSQKINNLAEMSEHSTTKVTFRNSLSALLQKAVTNRKERTKLINNLQLPAFPEQELKSLQSYFDNVLTALRMPQDNGTYRYAKLLRSSGGYVTRDNLVAHHEIGNWQEFQKSYIDSIYSINIFSPTKNGLFRNNRDVYLHTMTLNYHAEGQEKKVVHNFDRFLRRGERIDYELPDIAERLRVSLKYACRPEHRGSANFSVQPVQATIEDSITSPFAAAVSAIKAFDYEKKSITQLQKSLENIGRELQTAAIIAAQL